MILPFEVIVFCQYFIIPAPLQLVGLQWYSVCTPHLCASTTIHEHVHGAVGSGLYSI